VSTVVAVDLGATSVRVVVVDLAASPPRPRVVHRAANVPVRDERGHLRWDWAQLIDDVDRGLALALVEEGPIASIGVDTWGVDYGLLDERGRLVAPPFSYRDHRTGGWPHVVERVGGERVLYERTGLQLQPFTTLFQLAAHAEQHPDELAATRHLLLLPELVVHHLTGTIVGEHTSAGTSGLVDLETGTWSPSLLDAVGVRPTLLPEIRSATTPVGTWKGVPVHLVGGHDTASAVAAAPVADAFVASGTWLLVGREQPTADTSEAARGQNLSNEPGVLGGTRLLRNVAGFWLLERCRPAWGDGGRSVAELCAAAAALDPVPDLGWFDATDARWLAPADMLGEVTTALDLPRDADPVVVTRGILDSMAATTAHVVAALPRPHRSVGDDPASGGADRPHDDAVSVVGGGVQAALLLSQLQARTGAEVLAGPVEAAALGNALVQGIALGRWADLDEARAALAAPNAGSEAPAWAPAGGDGFAWAPAGGDGSAWAPAGGDGSAWAPAEGEGEVVT
jgi:rhamnulokinase